MKKPLLIGVVALLIGAGVGAGVMRLIDSRESVRRADDAPKQPDPGETSGEPTEPVVAALTTLGFLSKITGRDGVPDGTQKASGFNSLEGRTGNNGLGAAAWYAEPVDEKALRERVVGALRTAVAAGGGTFVSREEVAVRVLRADTSHALHQFICRYNVKMGDRVQMRQAIVWVTVPSLGTQHSACYCFGPL